MEIISRPQEGLTHLIEIVLMRLYALKSHPIAYTTHISK